MINPTPARCILSRDVIFLKKTFGQWAHVKEPSMLPAMTSVDDDKNDNISPLAEKLVYISHNDLEDESNNNLLLANKQLSSDEDSDNNEGPTTTTKEVVPFDKKLVNAMIKLDKSYKEDAPKIARVSWFVNGFSQFDYNIRTYHYP